MNHHPKHFKLNVFSFIYLRQKSVYNLNNSKYIAMICEYCKKKIRKRNKNKILLVNICQPIPELIFCGKECKVKWSNDVQNDIVKKIVEWSVERIFDNYCFVKYIRKISPISDKALTMSFFSENLLNSSNSDILGNVKIRSGKFHTT